MNKPEEAPMPKKERDWEKEMEEAEKAGWHRCGDCIYYGYCKSDPDACDYAAESFPGEKKDQ